MEMERKGKVGLGRWSCQMNFNMISSIRVEREHPLGGFTRKSKGNDLG
jgi:hypothetical protein